MLMMINPPEPYNLPKLPNPNPNPQNVEDEQDGHALRLVKIYLLI